MHGANKENIKATYWEVEVLLDLSLTLAHSLVRSVTGSIKCFELFESLYIFEYIF